MVETNKEELNWELELNPTKSEHIPIGNSSHFVTNTIRSFISLNTQALPTVCTTKDLGIVLNTRLSAEDKARRMLFYMKRSFAALTLSNFLPLFKTFIRPHLEYAIQATHPVLCRDAEALEKVQKLARKFVKGLRHVPYEAALQQLRLFSLTHRRIRGDLIAVFMITHGLLEFLMASTFANPTRKGLRGHAYTFHKQMLNAPSLIHLYHSGCPILEQTTC